MRTRSPAVRIRDVELLGCIRRRQEASATRGRRHHIVHEARNPPAVQRGDVVGQPALGHRTDDARELTERERTPARDGLEHERRATVLALEAQDEVALSDMVRLELSCAMLGMVRGPEALELDPRLRLQRSAHHGPRP